MPTNTPGSRTIGSHSKNETMDSDLGRLFEHQLQDTYFAESAITTALPKMIKAAHSDELKGAFEKHLKQTEQHVARLEKIFQMINRNAEGTPCEAIKGIIREGDEIAAEFGKTRAGDAGLAAAAQAVEHYEIARYGTLKAWAQELGLEKAVILLETTEGEEIDTDQLLSELAARFNASAAGEPARP